MGANKSSTNTWDNKGNGDKNSDSVEHNSSRANEGRGNGPSDKSSSSSLPNYSKKIAEILSSDKK